MIVVLVEVPNMLKGTCALSLSCAAVRALPHKCMALSQRWLKFSFWARLILSDVKKVAFLSNLNALGWYGGFKIWFTKDDPSFDEPLFLIPHHIPHYPPTSISSYWSSWYPAQSPVAAPEPQYSLFSHPSYQLINSTAQLVSDRLLHFGEKGDLAQVLRTKKENQRGPKSKKRSSTSSGSPKGEP